MPVVCKRLQGGEPPRGASGQPVAFGSDLGGTIPLPFDGAAVARQYQEDPDIFIAVNAIVSAVCGRGYEIIGDDAAAREVVRAQFERLSEESPFLETLRQALIDFNLLGNGYLEVGRGKDDRPGGAWWAPATEVRLRKAGGFTQTGGGRAVEFNPYTPSEGRRRALRKAGEWKAGAHELLHLRLANPNSRHYGLPPAYTVSKEIVADAACKDSNIALFQNGLCPDYAVLVRGGTLSDETATMVREYLQEAHQGPSRHHGFLVLEAAGGPNGITPEIELTPIQGRLSDMQWAKYRQMNMESKIRAFRVPMSKAGINQHGRLGEASSRGEDDTFKYQVVEPQQTLVERALTRMIADDLEAPGVEFRFKELDVKDEWSRAQTASLLTGGKAVLTVNEARSLLGLAPVEGGDAL